MAPLRASSPLPQLHRSSKKPAPMPARYRDENVTQKSVMTKKKSKKGNLRSSSARPFVKTSPPARITREDAQLTSSVYMPSSPPRLCGPTPLPTSPTPTEPASSPQTVAPSRAEYATFGTRIGDVFDYLHSKEMIAPRGASALAHGKHVQELVAKVNSYDERFYQWQIETHSEYATDVLKHKLQREMEALRSAEAEATAESIDALIGKLQIEIMRLRSVQAKKKKEEEMVPKGQVQKTPAITKKATQQPNEDDSVVQDREDVTPTSLQLPSKSTTAEEMVAAEALLALSKSSSSPFMQQMDKGKGKGKDNDKDKGVE